MKSKINYTVQIIIASAIACSTIYFAIKESVPGIGIGGTIFSFTSLKYKIFSIYRQNKGVFEAIASKISKKRNSSNSDLNKEIEILKKRVSALENRSIR